MFHYDRTLIGKFVTDLSLLLAMQKPKIPEKMLQNLIVLRLKYLQSIGADKGVL
jgi:hypothetical protein